MADTQKKRLTIEIARRVWVGYGCAALVFVPLFVGGGGALLLLAAGLIGDQENLERAPRIALALVGILFASLGLWIAFLGVRSIALARKVKRAKLERPAEPWWWDYPWDVVGITDDSLQGMLSHFAAALLFVVFLAPFNWWAFFSDLSGLFVVTCTVAFDAVALRLFGKACVRLVRLAKYGRSFLRFERFPYLLGETLDAHLECSRRVRLTGQMTLTLRCVEQAFESYEDAKLLVCYQIYADTMLRETAPLEPGLSTTISFPLPQDRKYVTSLSQEPIRYWELEAKAETPGVDYLTTFLLPVYAPPDGTPSVP